MALTSGEKAIEIGKKLELEKKWNEDAQKAFWSNEPTLQMSNAYGFNQGYMAARRDAQEEINELKKSTGYSTNLSGATCNNCGHQDRD